MADSRESPNEKRHACHLGVSSRGLRFSSSLAIQDRGSESSSEAKRSSLGSQIARFNE